MRIEMDKIYCGDSLQVLQTLTENAVDCCVTSPPYYALRDYGADGQIGREATPEEEAKAVDTLRRILRYLREIPPGPRTIPIPEMNRYQMDYLLPLMATEKKLRQGEYRNACNELMDLVYFYPVLRPGIWRNLIGLLEEYVEG